MSNVVKGGKGIINIANIEIKSVESLVQKRAQFSKYLRPIGLADTAVYHYVKDGGFFGKKEQRITFTFFEGLNTNPQNLSIFLRDMVNNFSKQSKQKLSKGQFFVYDIFNETDCVIEISIPGNFQIYKIKNGKKELISNNEIDSMYVSSTLRSMYEKNLSWGKCYNLFGCKGILDQFKAFVGVFFRVVEKVDISISEDYEHKSSIKGTHSCSILFEYIKSKRIVHHSIDIIEKQIAARGGYSEAYPKMLILLSELYSYDGKYAKSLSIIGLMMKKFSNDPYLMFYEAKYMFQLMVVHEALLITNSIVQYNQFQIWCLAAELHLELKNYSQCLVCLNHASRIAGKSAKSSAKNVDIDTIYAQFEKLGKKNILAPEDQITQRPKLMSVSQNPLSIIGNVEQKFKNLVDNQYYRMGFGQKIVYNLLRALRYRLQTKKFQQLLQSTFEESKKHYPVVNFRTGMTESMFVQAKNDVHELKQNEGMDSKNEQELPNFLKDQSIQMEVQEATKGNRNLSIIPELESVIQNSQFQQKQKQSHKMVSVKHKKELSENLFKIIKSVLSENQIQKAEFQQNWAKVLPVYNKLRTSSKLNSFYSHKMFQIMMKIENHKSILVLIAESLDAYEQLGSRKIEVLPFWMQKYIFEIIEEKGLKFLNGLLQKMNFFDQAVIDTIQLAKNWKIKGCTF